MIDFDFVKKWFCIGFLVWIDITLFVNGIVMVLDGMILRILFFLAMIPCLFMIHRIYKKWW